jgi:hypothetical protein
MITGKSEWVDALFHLCLSFEAERRMAMQSCQIGAAAADS